MHITFRLLLHKCLLNPQDYGVWNVSYASVPCTQWAGWNDISALGSAASLESSGCCPANPTVRDLTEVNNVASHVFI